MTVEQAGEYYLDWICWSNKSSRSYTRLVAPLSWSTMTQKKYREAAKRAAKIHRTAALALDAPPQPWPANLAKPISKVVTSLLSDVDALNQLAAAKTAAQVQRANGNLGQGGNSGAQLARLRLGLPSAKSKNDGCKGKGRYPLADSASATPSPSASASVSASS